MGRSVWVLQKIAGEITHFRVFFRMRPKGWKTKHTLGFCPVWGDYKRGIGGL